MYSGYLLEKYKQIFQEEVIESLAKPLKQSIRINELKATEDELVPRLKEKGILLEKIPWTRKGYFVTDAPFSIGATPEYLLGYYFIQDAASMYACEVLAPQRGEVVLDMTASPGGKTTYLAQLMDNDGAIIALELNRERMKSLRSNISRMGVENTIAIRMDALAVEELGILFDRILLDVPCTGVGTVSKNPEAAQKIKEDVSKCSALQIELLQAAERVLKKGGILVYSTCSFLPEENEFVVQQALDDLSLRLEDVQFGEEAFTECYGVKLSKDMAKAKRFYPHIHGTQGFFIARLRK
ncbi:MAG: RsmB/NOP family class I SAM-dependent RNA methyltransferase [Candidatus Hydrothermarchaeales archaeon]